MEVLQIDGKEIPLLEAPQRYEDPPRRIAAGAQGGLGRDHPRRGRAVAVAGEQPLDRQVEVALARRVVRGVVAVVDHLGDDALDGGVAERARLGVEPAVLGHYVRAADAARDRADVRGRLVVEPPQAEVRDRPRRRGDRRTPFLRIHPRVRGTAAEYAQLVEDVCGHALTLNDVSYQVIGVASERFTGEWVGQPADVWLPLSMHTAITRNRAVLLREDSTAQWLRVFARLDA